MKYDDIYLSSIQNKPLITMIHFYPKYNFYIAVHLSLDLELVFIAAASSAFQLLRQKHVDGHVVSQFKDNAIFQNS